MRLRQCIRLTIRNVNCGYATILFLGNPSIRLTIRNVNLK